MTDESRVIATPISHLFENLEDAMAISKLSDCLEARERTVNLQFDHSRLFHIDVDLTLPWDDKIKGYLSEIISAKKDLEFVTFQTTRCCFDEVIEDGMYKLSGKKLSAEELTAYAHKNISWLREIISPKFGFGIENNNYYPTEAYDIVTDPVFISRLVSSLGLFFLFDLAHARVSAHNLHVDFASYCDSLPLDRMLQMHICEPYIPDRLGEGLALDIHELPTEETMDLVGAFTNRFPNLKYYTIEYYKNSSLLCTSLIKLRQRLENVDFIN